METKICTKCKMQKTLDHFGKHSGVKSGLQPACRACLSAQTKNWYGLNKERKAATVAAWQAANPEVRQANIKDWVEANREKTRAYTRKWAKSNRPAINEYKRKYRHQNPEAVVRHEIRRRTSKTQAEVAWADTFLIGEIYSLSKLRTKLTGVKFAVDHIVPLRNKHVCGLHVESNLRIVENHINVKKGNRWWPDMWENENA